MARSFRSRFLDFLDLRIFTCVGTWAQGERPILNFDSTYSKLKLRKIFVGVKNGNGQQTAAPNR